MDCKLDSFAPSRRNRVYNALTACDISLDHVRQTTEKLRSDDNLRGIWPERLLHVESMKSFCRQMSPEGIFYNGVREPAFSALSYKWGLHVVDEGPTLEIEGIAWDPPSIDQEYFTVANHTRVLRRMAEYSGWVWVDVGCITQLLMEETMREIIVEPQYFKQATQRFVWWVDYPPEAFRCLLNKVSRAEGALRQLPSLSDNKVDYDVLPSIFAEVLAPLNELMSIPWFSSNWTLRELMLCDNILILDKEAELIHVEGENETSIPATIDMIATLCGHILAWLTRLQLRLSTMQPPEKTTVLQVKVPQDMGTEPPKSPPEKVTISTLASEYIHLVETHGAFFLYSSRPADLHHWTKALLETGRLITKGLAEL
ncbi:hypothetical protein FE257_008071 [Aspergillus nanangensis]|uniref:Heterokaryon incompatibility domain-containing protein n=1 Tax=Aspergillus nanangensis TaxID=2582783 RepID=A0AAD4GT24_ASPNN|nr:hypothetical protein FE257_008071 [Aspergillus nanangensis]